jgi:hypothetical protein
MSYCWNDPLWDIEQCQGSGSVVLVLSSYLQSFLVAHGSDPENRDVWVTLMVQDHLIGLYVIYAPNLNSEHRQLWDWMASSLSATDWILWEDLNMVEWDGDHGGGVGHVISGAKKQAWF